MLPSVDSFEGGVSQVTSGQSSADEAQREFVAVVLADTEEVWSAIFWERGMDYRTPKLVLFSSAVQSACGLSESATGPFYCPGDEKIYIDLDFLSELQQCFRVECDFAAAYIIAHEVGHFTYRSSSASPKRSWP